MNEITVHNLLEDDKYTIFDVRSPIEFREGCIAGAINVPLFSDEERHQIGIIYKNEGQDAAKWRAMEFVSPKIPTMLQTIKEQTKSDTAPVIYCWRGGMRSKSVTMFLEFAGINGIRLIGGYKAFRQHILSSIPNLLPKKAIILHGVTGVGKTEILKNLSSKNLPVIDLEYLAGHRGSIFGTIGMGDGNSQKMFDALLYKRLIEIKYSDYFIMEAESKRIGRIIQPEELLERKKGGTHFLVKLPMQKRIQHIVQEYVIPFQNEDWFHDKITEIISKLTKRIKEKETARMIEDYCKVKNYSELIFILLEKYYDPKYNHKRLEYDGHFYEIKADSITDATRQIEKHLNLLGETLTIEK